MKAKLTYSRRLAVALSLASLHVAVLYSSQQQAFAVSAFQCQPVSTPTKSGFFKSTRGSQNHGSIFTSVPPTTSSSATTIVLHSSLAVTTAVSALDAFCQNSPYAAAALICGFKASAADMVAQKRDFRKRDEKKRKNAAAAAALEATTTKSTEAATEDAAVIYNADLAAIVQQASKADWKRNVAFVLYGSLYQGVTQEFVYNHLYPVWFGSATSIPVVLTKVFFDLLVQTTLVTLPIAYLTKSIIYRYSFKEALRRYVDDIKNHGLLKKYYLLWGPVQCLTFGVVPEHWRVPFIAFVSFFWLIILSTIASKSEVAVGDQADALVAECSLEDGLTCNIDG